MAGCIARPRHWFGDVKLEDARTDRSRTVIPTVWLRMRKLLGPQRSRAEVAIEIVTEARWKDGERRVGDYWIALLRGQCMTTITHLADVAGMSNRTSVKRMVDDITSRMGWTVEHLKASDPRVRPVATPRRNLGSKVGSNLGIIVTICNYDDLLRFGSNPGSNPGSKVGSNPMSQLPTPRPPPTPGTPTPVSTEHVVFVEPDQEPTPAPEPRAESAEEPAARAEKYREALEEARAHRRTTDVLSMLRGRAAAGDRAARIVLDEANEAAAATSEMMRERWCDDQR